jgi:hypothetical protein
VEQGKAEDSRNLGSGGLADGSEVEGHQVLIFLA